MSALIQDHLKHNKEKDRQEKDNGAWIAALATNFKQTADALGGRVQAAAAHDKFRMFLNANKKSELQELKYTGPEDSSDEA